MKEKDMIYNNTEELKSIIKEVLLREFTKKVFQRVRCCRVQGNTHRQEAVGW